MKLGESNYKTWKTDMTDVLLNEELWRIVSGKDKGPTGGSEEKKAAWESRAARAAAIIRLAMEDKIRARYTAEELMDDPVTLWKKIAEDRKAVVVLDKNYLITQLHQEKLEDRGSVTAYVDAINTIIDNLATCVKKVDDNDHWFYLTNGLPASWAVFHEVLEGPGSSATRDIPGLVSRMLAKEAQLKREKGISADAARYTKKASYVSTRKGGQSTGQDTRGTLPECFYCGRKGHKRFKCHKFKADMASSNLKPRATNTATSGSGQASGRASGHSTAAKATEDFMWSAQEVCTAAGKPTLSAESSWIVDSGCSHHLTGSRALFVPGSYVEYPPGEHQIRVADNGVRGAAGYGDVMVNVRNPGGNGVRTVTVRSVLHVPDCGDINLLSMGQLEDLGIGFKIGVHKGVYHLVRYGIVVAEMDKVGGIYVLRTGEAREAAVGVAEDSKQG